MHPTPDQLRLIACTCICQKIIEAHLLSYAQTHMEKHIHITQLGFIREGECPMHILGAI